MMQMLEKLDISIHALREEGDRRNVTVYKDRIISIHALREEGDVCVEGPCACVCHFYPRPP